MVGMRRIVVDRGAAALIEDARRSAEEESEEEDAGTDPAAGAVPDRTDESEETDE